MKDSKPIEGDLVVVVGCTREKKGVTARHRILAEVMAVGKMDLFVRSEGREKVFQVPTSKCCLVDDRSANVDASIIVPEIGDLVLSIVDRLSKVERKMGVLIEISDVPGSIKMARILKGETTERVAFSSLIVLE
tara:strand:- start:253 stop:654 length:402 start_codon:yes stop_codon:yes gene_type:complete